MTRHTNRTLVAAAGCSTLVGATLTGCGSDADAPMPPEPPAAEAPEQPGADPEVEANAQGNVDDEYVRVCYNKDTHERVEDDQCPEEEGNTEVHNHYHSGGSPLTPLLWYYIGRSSAQGNVGPIIPAVGSQIAQGTGTTERPKNGSIAHGVSRDERPFADSYRSSKNVGYTGGGKSYSDKKQAVTQRDSARQQRDTQVKQRQQQHEQKVRSNNQGNKRSGGFGGSHGSRGGHGG